MTELRRAARGQAPIADRAMGPAALFRVAVGDAASPAGLVMGAYYAFVAVMNWLTLPEPARLPVASLAAATSAAFVALAWAWSRRTPVSSRVVTTFVCLVTLNNAVALWHLYVPGAVVGQVLQQVGVGFVGLSWRRFWSLTATIFAVFLLGMAWHGSSADWQTLTLAMLAAGALSVLMQTASAGYRLRLASAQQESERQRRAAEANLALVRAEVARRESLQERLARAERLESLGLLAGGVAHDFNNLLAVMIGNASVAIERTSDPELRGEISEILDAGDRASLLAKELLAYAGRGAQDLVPLDLAGETLGVCKLARSSLPPRVALRTQGVDGAPVVRADRGQLQQVILNLILNAGDAIAGRGGVVEASTGRERLSAETAALLEPALARPPGTYCFLRIADTGNGMSAETMRHVFDPFFTTKQPGRGLGLSAALGIARAHGGGFRVASQLGVGSDFTLYLPECDEPVREPAKPRAARAPQAGVAILVVDDQELVRRMLARALTSAGYRAFEASGGAEAERVLHADGGEIAAAIVDMSMPEVDGEETLERLRRIRPGLPVLLSSGFDAHEVATRLAKHPGVAFLAKPYRVDELKRRVLDLLEAPPHSV